jgi:alpha-D-xyloside xylohydrolase
MDGEAKGVFMKVNGETFIGQVWPNDAAFPDFFNDTAVQWWKDNLNSMHKLLPFDGLWLDMNEASNFCVGACYKR